MKSSTCVLFLTTATSCGTGAAGPSNEEWKASRAAVADEAAAARAKNAKMAAVNKVIDLMESLKDKVLEEGEKEAKTYDKFACFCKDTTTEKTDAIQKGEDSKAALASKMEELTSARTKLDEEIAQLESDIKASQKAQKEAKAERATTLSIYEKNSADLQAALDGLTGAIDAVKSSKKPALVQLQSVAKTVQTAMELADAMGLSTTDVSSFLQQADPANDVPMEDYKFHSGGIITTLEKLMDQFRKQKNEVDATEVESVMLFDKLMQGETDLEKQKNVDLDAASEDKANKQTQLSEASERYSTISALLLDDQQYLRELSSMCSDKAKTWDQRTQVRSDEINALVSATSIIKTTVAEKTRSATVRLAQQGVAVIMAERKARTPEAMDAIEEEAEAADSSPDSFLQRIASHNPADGRHMIATLLRSKGQQLKSTLLSALASQIENTAGADPFAKIKVMIQGLIERLLSEASEESNQKGWCDKATADAEQKKEYAAKQVGSLNAEMASLEATRDKLTEELGLLEAEIKGLRLSQAEAEKDRAEESAENDLTTQEAEAGEDAVSMAIDILNKFYKSRAKSTVDLSLAQGPMDDAPDAGFDNGEAYTGAGGASGGIVGMLEIIQSDFQRTISVTFKAEAQAAKDYLKFETESGMSLAEKTMGEAQKKKQKDNAEDELATADDSMKGQLVILTTSIKELLELKPQCVDTGMSYEERVARREDEIESLKKALCILIAYQEYGPEGLSDAC